MDTSIKDLHEIISELEKQSNELQSSSVMFSEILQIGEEIKSANEALMVVKKSIAEVGRASAIQAESAIQRIEDLTTKTERSLAAQAQYVAQEINELKRQTEQVFVAQAEHATQRIEDFTIQTKQSLAAQAEHMLHCLEEVQAKTGAALVSQTEHVAQNINELKRQIEQDFFTQAEHTTQRIKELRGQMDIFRSELVTTLSNQNDLLDRMELRQEKTSLEYVKCLQNEASQLKTSVDKLEMFIVGQFEEMTKQRQRQNIVGLILLVSILVVGMFANF